MVKITCEGWALWSCGANYIIPGDWEMVAKALPQTIINKFCLSMPRSETYSIDLLRNKEIKMAHISVYVQWAVPELFEFTCRHTPCIQLCNSLVEKFT